MDLLEVKKMFAEDFNGACRHLVKETFEGIMRLDLEAYLGADRYERSERRHQPLTKHAQHPIPQPGAMITPQAANYPLRTL